MHLKEIEYFIAIAEAGSISKAAGELYVSQPSLSAYLSRMEKSLGISLFLRYNSKLSLTKAGTIYYEAAKKISDVQRKALSQIEDLIENVQSSICIGVTGERSLRFLSKMFPVFYQKYPNIHISIFEKPAADLVQLIKENEIDIGIFAFQGDDPELVEVLILREEIVLALPQQHRLAEMGSHDARGPLQKIDIRQLQADPFVLLKKGTVLRAVAERHFQHIGFYPNALIEAQSSYSSMSIVSSGIAVGLCPKNYEFQNCNVVYIAPDEPFYYESGVAYKKGAYLTLAQKSLIGLFKEHGDLL